MKSPLVFLMKLFALVVSAAFITGCATSQYSQAPKISSEEARSYEKAYRQQQQPYVDVKGDFTWFQASNKQEPCKLFVGGNIDRTQAYGYKLYWDGDCRDGYAIGLGREFELSPMVNLEAIANYKGGKVEPDYYVNIDNLNNVVTEGNLNDGYVVNTNIYDENINFNITYRYGYLGSNGGPFLYIEMSPFVDELHYFYMYQNFAYQFSDLSNNEFDDRNFTFALLNQNWQFNGYASHFYKNGVRKDVEYTNGNLVRAIELPQDYLIEVEQKYNEVIMAGQAALNAQKTALAVKKQYQLKICDSQENVGFISQTAYKKICPNSFHEQDIKSKFEKKLLSVNSEKQKKRDLIYQQDLANAKLKQEIQARQQQDTQETIQAIQSLGLAARKAGEQALNSVQNYSITQPSIGYRGGSKSTNYMINTNSGLQYKTCTSTGSAYTYCY